MTEDLAVNSPNLVQAMSNTPLNASCCSSIFNVQTFIDMLVALRSKDGCCPSKPLSVCQARGRKGGKKAKVTCQFLKNISPKRHPVASVYNLLSRIVSHVPGLKMAAERIGWRLHWLAKWVCHNNKNVLVEFQSWRHCALLSTMMQGWK